MSDASVDTLMRRVLYGGRKGRRAVRRLLRIRYVHPQGGLVFFSKTGRGIEMTMASTLNWTVPNGS